MDLIGDHLWQSTLFAAVAALSTLFFRKNHARVRYALWLVASLKFLIPFSLLIAIGSSLHFSLKPPIPAAQPAVSFVRYVIQDSSGASLQVPQGERARQTRFIPDFLLPFWLCGSTFVFIAYWRKGRRVRVAFGRCHAGVPRGNRHVLRHDAERGLFLLSAIPGYALCACGGYRWEGDARLQRSFAGHRQRTAGDFELLHTRLLHEQCSHGRQIPPDQDRACRRPIRW
jgi:hypothetical protein